jgi:hypothetical protein
MTDPVKPINDPEETMRCLTGGMAEQIGLFLDCYLGGFIDHEIATAQAQIVAATARINYLQAMRSGALCTGQETQGVWPSESVSATSIADVLEN